MLNSPLSWHMTADSCWIRTACCVTATIRNVVLVLPKNVHVELRTGSGSAAAEAFPSTLMTVVSPPIWQAVYWISLPSVSDLQSPEIGKRNRSTLSREECAERFAARRAIIY